MYVYNEFRPAYDLLLNYKLLSIFKMPEIIGFIRLPKEIQS